MNYKLPNYKAWKVNYKDFPKNSAIEAKIHFLANYGILAPSVHNTQPWRLNIKGNLLKITPDLNNKLEIADPNNYGIYIAIGAMIENICVAANVFGLETEVNVENATEIGIKFKESKKELSKKDETSVVSIINRYSDKLEYKVKKIPKDIINEIQKLSDDNIEIRVIQDSKLKKELISNHLSAAAKVASNPEFARELINWLKTNKTKESYGMPGFVVGNSSGKSIIGKTLLKKNPKLLLKSIAQDEKLLNSSDALIIFLTSSKVTESAALNLGRAIESLWLKLTQYQVSAHPLYASIQDKTSSVNLAKILNTKKEPVFFMRAGYSQQIEPLHTPRLILKNGLRNSIEALSEQIPVEIESHKIKIGKYSINYIVAGKGKPILMIHGANIGWPQWHLNIAKLAKNFKIYAIDLPGAGESTKVTFRDTDFVKDYLNIVDEFIEKLDLGKIDIIGSSFGGWIALKLAIERKPYIDRLILANPIGFTRHMPVKFRPVSISPFALMMSKTVLKPVRKNKNLEMFMRDVFNDKKLPLMNEFIDYFYELSKESHNVLFISKLAHFSGMRKELYVADQLESINVPTLVIWGKEDPLMPFKTVERNLYKIKNSKTIVLEGVGHMPPVEAAEAFNDLVVSFLKKN